MASIGTHCMRVTTFGVIGALLLGGAEASRGAVLEGVEAHGLDLLPQESPEVVRSRYVAVDLTALPKPRPGEAMGLVDARLSLNLFDDATFDVALERFEPGVPGHDDSYVLVGTIVGMEHSLVVLGVHKGIVTGDVYTAGDGVYQIRWAGKGVHAARQADRSKLWPCGNTWEDVIVDPAQKEPNPENAQRSGDGDVGPVIDVLVVYTPAAQNHAGGQNVVEAAIPNWFATTNSAYRNSGIRQRLRLVHLALTNYTESGGSSTDLSRLRGTSDGFMDEVHALRNQYGADIVHLASMSLGVCGQAYLMSSVSTGFASSAFGLTVYPCGALTFAHEIGHNAGCNHDHDNAGGGGAYCYSFGYRTPAPVVQKTIMSYDPGQDIPFFSNPDVIYLGRSLGVSGVGCPGDAADNARSQNNTANTVAAFRAQVVPNPPPAAFAVMSPANGSAGASTETSLTWQAAMGATSYNVVLADNPDFLDPIIDTKGVTSTSINVPAGSLENCGTYYWSVMAVGLATQTVVSPEMNSFTVRALADVNGDGLVGSTDLSVMLGSWGACPPAPSQCSSDINGDGFITSADLSLLLGSWGMCP